MTPSRVDARVHSLVHLIAMSDALASLPQIRDVDLLHKIVIPLAMCTVYSSSRSRFALTMT